MKLWDKKYKLNKDIERFTVGNDYLLDQELVKYDCLASIAHVKMLEKIGILKTEEAQKITKELNKIIKLDERGKFEISPKDEDCHTAIENHLTRELGNAGKKVHTARSRNDQVATALRLYYKEELGNCSKLISNLGKTLKKFKNKYGRVMLPGYTHTRKAMPSSISLWCDSFIDSMEDNLKRIKYVLEIIDQSPLGTGAGYGVPLEIDRKFTAKLLGLKKIQENPIYVQNSRGKFEADILHALSQIMLDLNKISTDLIMFSMPEFGYFELPKEFCTGSSIMPQKKNPDVLELLRAKYHLVVSHEMQVKNIIGNLISGYHRDFQLTKGAVMQGLKITEESLAIMSLVFQKLRANRENCEKALTKEVYATQKAYDLVKKGMPFRKAYKIVAEEYEK